MVLKAVLKYSDLGILGDIHLFHNYISDSPHAKDQRMGFDDFSLAGEGEVASLLLARVQLARTRGEVGGGKAHPTVSKYII